MGYLLFTDETNIQPSQTAKFFIYGGVFFDLNVLPEIHQLIKEVRIAYGFNDQDELKFDTRSRPDNMTPDKHILAKNAILNGCAEKGVKFVACLILHEIAKNRNIQELIGWSANAVIGAFDRFLAEEGASGICIFDRLPFKQSFDYLKEKFQIGLTLSYGGNRKLNRIKLFALSCIGASHISSAIDIILGAFRYCVNERGREVPRTLFPIIASMMWHKRVGNIIYLRERGLLLRPREVRIDLYRKEYEDLIEYFKELCTQIPIRESKV